MISNKINIDAYDSLNCELYESGAFCRLTKQPGSGKFIGGFESFEGDGRVYYSNVLEDIPFLIVVFKENSECIIKDSKINAGKKTLTCHRKT